MKKDPTREIFQKEDMELNQNLLTPEVQISLERLEEYIKEGPKLERSEPSRIFYIKTNWSRNEIGAVLLQANESAETRRA